MGILRRIWRTMEHCSVLWRRSPAREHRLIWRPSGDYQAYMIRFWRTDPDVPWRAAVVDPHQDAIRYFADREALYAFLDAQIDGR